MVLVLDRGAFDLQNRLEFIDRLFSLLVLGGGDWRREQGNGQGDQGKLSDVFLFFTYCLLGGNSANVYPCIWMVL